MNNKGFAYNTLMMLFFYFVIVFFTAGLLYFFAYGVAGKDSSTTDLTVALFLDQLYELPNVVTVVEDETGRMQSSTILLEHFSSLTLDDFFTTTTFSSQEQPRLAAELRLQHLDSQPVFLHDIEISPAYYSKQWYDRWNILPSSLFRGKGSVDRYVDKRIVTLITDTGERKQGLLIVTVLIP